MFRGNVSCTIERATGNYDVYGQPAGYAAPVATSCLILKNKIREERTSVRFDTSASRGNADEFVGDLLIGLAESVSAGDKITIRDVEYSPSALPVPISGRNGCIAYNEVILSPKKAK